MFKSHVSGIVTHLPRLFLLHFVAFGLYRYTNFFCDVKSFFCFNFLFSFRSFLFKLKMHMQHKDGNTITGP